MFPPPPLCRALSVGRYETIHHGAFKSGWNPSSVYRSGCGRRQTKRIQFTTSYSAIGNRPCIQKEANWSPTFSLCLHRTNRMHRNTRFIYFIEINTFYCKLIIVLFLFRFLIAIHVRSIPSFRHPTQLIHSLLDRIREAITNAVVK